MRLLCLGIVCRFDQLIVLFAFDADIALQIVETGWKTAVDAVSLQNRHNMTHSANGDAGRKRNRPEPEENTTSGTANLVSDDRNTGSAIAWTGEHTITAWLTAPIEELTDWSTKRYGGSYYLYETECLINSFTGFGSHSHDCRCPSVKEIKILKIMCECAFILNNAE
jgi:hypothetical protein